MKVIYKEIAEMKRLQGERRKKVLRAVAAVEGERVCRQKREKDRKKKERKIDRQIDI